MSEESDDEFDATKLIVRKIPWRSMCKHYIPFLTMILQALMNLLTNLISGTTTCIKAKCVMAKKQRCSFYIPDTKTCTTMGN